ncbi:DUF937 domain-containing protein [Rhizobium sp. KVB221]|uniref:DUF937 domain-containing protein n=1 Tax=Rhizobium setariae TaxID=2801340 RepID=A0A936YQX0_9HYPH|nr:YidB family protein [Rhizobium setariae]MBL0372911.1 DUF937 domain-containing protein [Rhizobium setariae]
MSLLDNIGNLISDAMAGKQIDLMSLAQQALGNSGGMAQILNQLQQAGLGEQVSSWLGNSGNLPISAEQIKAALGNEQLANLAASLGIDINQVASVLSQQLPDAVDKASPNGQLDS